MILDLTILALAGGRLSYSIAEDAIWDRLRHRLFLWSPPSDTDPEGRPYRLWRKLSTVTVNMLNKAAADECPLAEDGDYVYSTTWEARREGFIGGMCSCLMCNSFWVSLVLAIGYLIGGHAFAVAMIPFALWAASNAFAKWLHS